MAKAKAKSQALKQHKFRDKLLLNQWLMSLFGIDPLDKKAKKRPFHQLAEPIRDPRLEGLDKDNLHHFYHTLTASKLFAGNTAALSKVQLLAYEENIVHYTQAINAKRHRPVVWKYYQWLSLLFVEIYLDRYFSNRESLLAALNEYVDRFNDRWPDFADMGYFNEDELNKLSLQNATGSGKTLLMHVNYLQYKHYAKQYGKEKNLSRAILISPNERLSEQHIAEFAESNIGASNFSKEGHGLFTQAQGLSRVDVLEITKLGDKGGPNTVATRSLGDQNLLLVDEGHRGLSGKNAKADENAWFKNRAMLCEKGFTFEYSATFDQAVSGTGHEDDYAKTVVFDYSYRWFYEDGFGKDYQILNLPNSFEETKAIYLTACLLKFYQQLDIFAEKSQVLRPFNIEKPLWVFVGSTVTGGKFGKDEQIVATDVAQIISFIADFLSNKENACRRMKEILLGKGQDTGLLDSNGVDIFEGSFTWLAKKINTGLTYDDIYIHILKRLFNTNSGGHLVLDRIKGESGEIALRVGTSETPFGLINVGDAKALAEHIENVAKQNNLSLTVDDSDFSEATFDTVKDSSSPVNLLIGSKKFVEGWDCWRVSTLGLMHVGKSEGAQIIQLFGRGVRLKGYDWSLKRSGHAYAPAIPQYIEELETLNVFGVEADFMEKFRQFLADEGLPGNERRRVFTIPLNVTYDFGKKLQIIRPKRKADDGKEYDFKKDAPVPTLGQLTKYLELHPVVSDWYPRIQSIHSKQTNDAAKKDDVKLEDKHIALLNFDQLYFDLEQFKRARSWHNLNIDKGGIQKLLSDNAWYSLFLPTDRLVPKDFAGVALLQQVATELLKRFVEHYYNYCKRSFIEPRLELRELTPQDDNIPQEEFYRLIVDGSEDQVILAIETLKKELEDNKKTLLKAGDLQACKFGMHMFQPLFHIKKGGKITILPVALNDSEFQFVTDLKEWAELNTQQLQKDGAELFLLRNQSRGKGVGFFEAGNFHPDFILWKIVGGKEYVTFIEPHGLLHEGPASDKVMFHSRIKDIEKRFANPDVILNSFILSPTKYAQLQWGIDKQDLVDKHVLFMDDGGSIYLTKMFDRIN
ncbi:DEAD/DEAH box helicase family protein [Providencia rettgeri]|uniref:DEAD/DEAH box helicase family protein n=1 Tax=Providencia rettgeri TaxID=587 RepID=UPI002880E9B0|nr:DEAD/DEAH box helicase family protein [Providencia rettgeri]ELM3937010.1 DEAD/DEAH box helicase family protein [Providencia rettgeri]EMA4644292.1 DEAD/DEAH box helicase family protein [Providencia rettgeri]MDK3109023.1 DEAD/DEAH box helicase family protein [Providencia rettgeri]WRR96844.1 DEAD/DEAH box helicase family protein [Providencia rettgeri]